MRDPLPDAGLPDPNDSPAPPHPRSILWCIADSDPEQGECQTQPFDRTDLVAMQEHVMRDHGVSQEALRKAWRIVLDAHTKLLLEMLKPTDAWPRRLDLVPTIIVWVTTVESRQARGPLYAAFRAPPAMADQLETRIKDLNLGWSVQP